MAASAALPSPALAQACEGSAKSKAGEVYVTAEAGGETATWIVERTEDVGVETANFSRPSLMLDFVFARGELTGPEATVVSISRISSEAAGNAPNLGAVWVEAEMDGRVIGWRASDSSKGHRALAEALRKQWPAKLVVTLQAQRQGGEALASAEFLLSRRADAQALAREALAGRECAG